MKMDTIYFKKISFIFFFLITFSSQQNYKRYYLNNTQELSFYTDTEYLLCTNISNSKIGDIIHVVFNIQNLYYSTENISYFFLENDISDLENITIPEETKKITIKNTRTLQYFITLYIDIEIKNEFKYLIFLLHNIPKMMNHAIITDTDESSVIGMTQYEEKKLKFDGKNPLLFYFFIDSFNNNFDFKISSTINILEEIDMKYTTSFHYFTSFHLKELRNFNELYPHIYQIKHDNNYSYYANIYPGLAPDTIKYNILAFKFNLSKPGELIFRFLKKNELELIKDIYFNEEKKFEPRNNFYINLIDYNYFVIKQLISNPVNNIFYSISKKEGTEDEYNFDIKALTCIEKKSNETLYKYCNISLFSDYKSRYLIIYPENNTPFSIRIVNHNEGNINKISINSTYTNFIQGLKYELFGFTDSNYDDNFYVKVQIHNSSGIEYFKHFLINKNLNDIYEIVEKNIILDYTYFEIDMEKYYYFSTKQIFQSGQQSLIIELYSNVDTNYTIERTITYDIPNEFCNISRNETKEISKIKNRNLFLQFNLNDIKNDERFLIKIEGLKSAFRKNKIFYSENEKKEFNETIYKTSNKCINELNEDKIIFNCNYSEYEVSKMKFLIFLNYDSNIKISNSKNEDKKEKKPEFNFIPLLIIISIIIIAIIIFFIVRKLKKNDDNNNDFNVSEGILPDK